MPSSANGVIVTINSAAGTRAISRRACKVGMGSIVRLRNKEFRTNDQRPATKTNAVFRLQANRLQATAATMLSQALSSAVRSP